MIRSAFPLAILPHTLRRYLSLHTISRQQDKQDRLRRLQEIVYKVYFGGLPDTAAELQKIVDELHRNGRGATVHQPTG